MIVRSRADDDESVTVESANVPPPPREMALDPFDLERIRATPLAEVGVDRVLLSVPVRRPGRNEFFRVHPSPDFTLECLVLEYSQEMSTDTYWVHPDLHALLVDEVRAVRMFTCATKNGNVFLWPAKLPGASTGGRRWAESALQVAEVAKSHWVKMVGNKELGAYDLFKARGELGDPVWPDKTLRELLELGFSGERLIDTVGHAVLRSLRGEL